MTQKEAFEEWFRTSKWTEFGNIKYVEFEIVWQAACEHCAQKCDKVVNEVYPEKIFTPPNEDEVKQLDERLLTQLSADMGRRIAKLIAEAIRNE